MFREISHRMTASDSILLTELSGSRGQDWPCGTQDSTYIYIHTNNHVISSYANSQLKTNSIQLATMEVLLLEDSRPQLRLIEGNILFYALSISHKCL